MIEKSDASEKTKSLLSEMTEARRQGVLEAVLSKFVFEAKIQANFIKVLA